MLLRGAFQRGASSEGDHNGGRESEVWRKKPGPSDPGADVESLPAGRTGSSCPAGYNGFRNRVSRGIRPGGGRAVAVGWGVAGAPSGARACFPARRSSSNGLSETRLSPIGPPSQHPGSQQVGISGSWPSGWPFGTVLSPRKHRSPRTDTAARLELALGPPVQSGKHGSPGRARSSGSVAGTATARRRPPPPRCTAARRRPHPRAPPATRPPPPPPRCTATARRRPPPPRCTAARRRPHPRCTARHPPSFRPHLRAPPAPAATAPRRPPPPAARSHRHRRHRLARARQPHHHLAPVTPYLSQCAPRIRGGERGVMGAPRSRQHPPRGSAGS
jgi:hypothetical protein